MIFRFITKPFKRWAFNKAKLYTFYYIKVYKKKYTIKFLNKRKKIAKLKCDTKIILLIDKLMNDDLLSTIQNNDNIDELLKIINNHLISNTNILDIYDYELILNFSNYIINLNYIIKKDIGLDHSKVREYWLKRGPRILITFIILLVSNYILYVYLKKIDNKTNLYLILINTIALSLSIYMLYFRLQDSIESAIARTTHDYYVKYKNELL